VLIELYDLEDFITEASGRRVFYSIVYEPYVQGIGADVYRIDLYAIADNNHKPIFLYYEIISDANEEVANKKLQEILNKLDEAGLSYSKGRVIL